MAKRLVVLYHHFTGLGLRDSILSQWDSPLVWEWMGDGTWRKVGSYRKAELQSVWRTRLCHRLKPASELTGRLKLYTAAFEEHLNGNLLGMLSEMRGGFPQFLCKYKSVRACIYIEHNVGAYPPRNIMEGKIYTHARTCKYIRTLKATKYLFSLKYIHSYTFGVHTLMHA